MTLQQLFSRFSVPVLQWARPVTACPSGGCRVSRETQTTVRTRSSLTLTVKPPPKFCSYWCFFFVCFALARSSSPHPWLCMRLFNHRSLHKLLRYYPACFGAAVEIGGWGTALLPVDFFSRAWCVTSSSHMTFSHGVFVLKKNKLTLVAFVFFMYVHIFCCICLYCFIVLINIKWYFIGWTRKKLLFQGIVPFVFHFLMCKLSSVDSSCSDLLCDSSTGNRNQEMHILYKLFSSKADQKPSLLLLVWRRPGSEGIKATPCVFLHHNMEP